MQGVGLGVRGWVLNILGRFFLQGGGGVVLQGMWDLSCPTGIEPTPSIESMES